MKLIRHGARGAERPGIVDAQGTQRDLSDYVDDIAGEAISEASLDRLVTLDLSRLPAIPVGTRIGPCVGRVGKFVCVGLNYADHAAEANLPVPKEPVIFLKANSSISGPYDDVIIPREARTTDWEVELGVVIGRAGKYISRHDALAHVAGYCVVNDVSEREYQMERGGQWTKGKSCDSFGPVGPWLVTKDEVPDPQSLDLWLEVDGQRRQSGSTRTMIFDVAHVVSYVSHFMSLQPGDLITTGTPPGVGMGMKPPTYLEVGQTMRLCVEGLGIQVQKVVADH